MGSRFTFAFTTLLYTIAAAAADHASHPPMRPLPEAYAGRPMADGPARFVDPAKGNDDGAGSKGRPWKTLAHALTKIAPGKTLCLRGGTYYEAVNISLKGTADAPITIRSYPGEIAVIDGGIREFFENPAEAWEPFEGGAPGEYRSVKAYPHLARDAHPPRYVYAMGNFGDSMIPLHGYAYLIDMRWPDMYVGYESKFSQTGGMYCGPGVWYDARPVTEDAYGTFRIHIRLAHTRFPALGDKNYTGETDPRKLPLVISGPEPPVTLAGAKHVLLQDLVLRGSRSATLRVQNCEGVTLDGLTVYGGAPALFLQGNRRVKLLNSALRGVSAPWSSRASEKYRGVSTYLVYAPSSGTSRNEDIEFGNCEFTDCHDGLWLLGIKTLDLHHSLVDNFNDDGLEFGPKDPARRLVVRQNRISQCLIPLTLHGRYREVPTGEGMGVYLCRNVIDQRETLHYGWPKKDGPQEITSHGWLMSDHGSPPWPVYILYHNTIIMHGSSWRGYYGSGTARATRGTRRRVFNNIILHVNGKPGFRVPPATDDWAADGQLQWGIPEAPEPADVRTLMKKANRKGYPKAWAANDIVADPKFVDFKPDRLTTNDLRLQPGSPAANAGVGIPGEWPDPVRVLDRGKPDIGAVPLGVPVWRIGIRGRLSPFGETVLAE